MLEDLPNYCHYSNQNPQDEISLSTVTSTHICIGVHTGTVKMSFTNGCWIRYDLILFYFIPFHLEILLTVVRCGSPRLPPLPLGWIQHWKTPGWWVCGSFPPGKASPFLEHDPSSFGSLFPMPTTYARVVAHHHPLWPRLCQQEFLPRVYWSWTEKEGLSSSMVTTFKNVSPDFQEP